MKKLGDSFYRYILYFLTRQQLAKNADALVIGITGSSGKTSCKETIAAFLKPHVENSAIMYSQSDASALGLCYQILGITNRRYSFWEGPFVLLNAIWRLLSKWEVFDIYLIEIGVNVTEGDQNIKDILSIINPHIGVILSIDTIHGERFERFIAPEIKGKQREDEIKKRAATEMFQLIEDLEDRSRAFISEDIVKYFPQEELKKIRIIGTQEDFEAIQGGNNLTGYHAIFKYNNKRYIVDLPGIVISSQATRNFEVAAKITTMLKFDLDKSFLFLSTLLKKEQGRSSILNGIKNTSIIDSSYNATFDSARGLLQTLKEVTRQKKHRRVVILGDLQEQNSQLQRSHEDIITEAVKVADLLILTNSEMLKYGVPKAKELGFVINENLFWFKNGKQLSYHVKNLIEENDVILVEGGQYDVFLEHSVEQLLENQEPEYVAATLPRMSSVLKRKKTKVTKK